ncbi:Alpha/Beta hydrolase protein [Syncephalis pseudoplumigaleata]|uniref:Alpha/Beta hydrolase protein n=1 Tax=Syncephalis pseudoplumigaleata TaxID=1712513 RepID=A0A4P9YVK1_9FUNG|nr:Alpha/Beta hydrolase protein [Syncephalis pseudoplumigaleata]|eukprot:RKP24093.1 Alpha/Beta hydrolase protein [Syncephalis pseudoplumigaleata]
MVAADRLPKPLSLSYKLMGSGSQRVLLIMGLSAAGDAWLPQATFIAKHDFQVCIFDNRGVGYSVSSSRANMTYSTKEMAHDTRELLDHIGWSSNVHVVGVSMGGMIALELTSTYPAYVASLCLTSSHAGMTMPPITGVVTLPRILMMTDIEKRIKAQCTMLFPKAWLEQPSKDDPSQTNEERMIALFKERVVHTPLQPLNGVLGQLSAVMRHHVGRERLQKIRETGIPILVCTGTEDNLVRPSNSHFMAEVLGARLVVFDGCGHLISLQEPERYNQLLVEHFQSVQSSAKTSS